MATLEMRLVKPEGWSSAYTGPGLLFDAMSTFEAVVGSRRLSHHDVPKLPSPYLYLDAPITLKIFHPARDFGITPGAASNPCLRFAPRV